MSYVYGRSKEPHVLEDTLNLYGRSPSDNIGFKLALYQYACYLRDECDLSLSNTVPIDEEASYEVANDVFYGNSFWLVDFNGVTQAIITTRFLTPPKKYAVVTLGG
tara:strand:+ start:863 stop:1180 length:318 start_codon:yes stop_codon:yes gene_type:complete